MSKEEQQNQEMAESNECAIEDRENNDYEGDPWCNECDRDANDCVC